MDIKFWSFLWPAFTAALVVFSTGDAVEKVVWLLALEISGFLYKWICSTFLFEDDELMCFYKKIKTFKIISAIWEIMQINKSHYFQSIQIHALKKVKTSSFVISSSMVSSLSILLKSYLLENTSLFHSLLKSISIDLGCSDFLTRTALFCWVNSVGDNAFSWS